jgi:hypothetical protein
MSITFFAHHPATSIPPHSHPTEPLDKLRSYQSFCVKFTKLTESFVDQLRNPLKSVELRKNFEQKRRKHFHFSEPKIVRRAAMELLKLRVVVGETIIFI